MQIQDAAKILEISGSLTKSIIKKAYRSACSKYHPDKGGSKEMMQAVNQAYEILKDFEGEVESGDKGYAEALNEALLKIIDLPGIEIEVCGAWIWVTGNTKPHKEALGMNGAGFRWASKKKAWYYRPSDWKSVSRGNFSLDDIRDKHGSEKVKGRKQKRVANAS